MHWQHVIVRGAVGFLIPALWGCASSRQADRLPPPPPTKAAKAATDSQPPASDIETRVKQAIDAYVSCSYAGADSHVSGTGTATEVAEAVAGECGREFNAYRIATQEFFVSQVSRSERNNALRQAEESAVRFKDEVRAAVISRVLRARGPRPR